MRYRFLARPLTLLLGLVIALGCDTSNTSGDKQTGDGETGSMCEVDEDCVTGNLCSLETCVPGCRPGSLRCPDGQVCFEMECVPEDEAPNTGGEAGLGGSGGVAGAGPSCPDEMVPIDPGTCIDRFEASRHDATSTSKGADDSVAHSKKGVMPWFPVTLPVARAACEAAGKRLCRAREFHDACTGPEETLYSYGDEYNAVICNGIDTFASYQAMPTGSMGLCVATNGAYDLNGNVWELIDDGTDDGHFRAGAYNCIDSKTLHECDHEQLPSTILAKGFRCCLTLGE